MSCFRNGQLRPQARKGFTLVELLVVIAIIGVLVALKFVYFVPSKFNFGSEKNGMSLHSFKFFGRKRRNAPLIRGGTYNESIDPANSGTSGAKITYRGYNGEMPPHQFAGLTVGKSKFNVVENTTITGWWIGVSAGQGVEDLTFRGNIVADFQDANHPPVPRIRGPRGKKGWKIERGIEHCTVAPGETVTLDATGSTDPDGDRLGFEWTVYPETGSYRGNPPTLHGATTSRASFVAPKIESLYFPVL